VQVLSDLVRKNGIYDRKTLRWNFRVIGRFLHLGSTSHESRIYEFLRYDYVAKGRRDFFFMIEFFIHFLFFHSFFIFSLKK
jgi:hypothetical protein